MIYLSHVALRLDIQAPGVADEARRRWASCDGAIVPTSHQAELRVVPNDGVPGHFRTFIDGIEANPRVPEAMLLTAVESCIYGRLRAWHRGSGTSLLHAGLMTKHGRALLFVGPSGAGKSSLCLAALERGWRYFTDDLTVTDGVHVWGIPRALQFDPIPAGEALIERLSDLTLLASQVDPDGPPAKQPALVVNPARLAAAPIPVERVHVIAIGQGDEDTVTPLGPGEAAQALIGATYEWPQRDVLWPARLPQGFRLQWSAPNVALAALEALLPPDAP